MSIDAIVMMVIAMLVLWGGLALAVVNLGRGGTADSAPPTHRDL